MIETWMKELQKEIEEKYGAATYIYTHSPDATLFFEVDGRTYFVRKHPKMDSSVFGYAFGLWQMVFLNVYSTGNYTKESLFYDFEGMKKVEQYEKKFLGKRVNYGFEISLDEIVKRRITQIEVISDEE